MTPAFDDRIFKVVFTYGTTQVTIDTQTGDTKKPIGITAIGTMYVNPLQSECTIAIANLGEDLRNQLLTQLTPFNLDQQRKRVDLYAGRVSTGLSLLYSGDITDATPSQPPDIVLTIKSQANQWFKYDVIAQAQNLTAPLSTIVNNAAQGMGLAPRFEATDKNVANYSYSGSRIKEIDHIADLGPYDVYTTGNSLVCKDKGKPLQGENIPISQDSGMIGKPMRTEWGVRVAAMFTPGAIIGGSFELVSKLDPLLNGTYTTYKYGFQLSSRDVPFYTILEGTKRYDLYTNTALPSA